MLNKRRLLPIAALLVLLLLVAWMAGLFTEKVAPGINNDRSLSPPRLFRVNSRKVALAEPVPASVAAKFATSISSRTLARITKIHVRAGDSVSQGQLLVELEQSDLLARAQQAREQIRGVTARLTEAEKNLDRMQRLQDQGIIPLAELDKALANRNALQAELAAAKQALEQVQSAVSYTEIRSPIDGRVVDRFAEPGDTAAPGATLLSIYNPLSLRIEAQVRERLALSLEVGQTLQVEIPSKGIEISAVVEERVPAAEPGSRTFLVKCRLQQQNDLLPGMYARLLVPLGEQAQILVPADRVVSVGQLNVVWVWYDGRANRRFVRVGERNGDSVRVISGLDEGDQLMLPPFVSS